MLIAIAPSVLGFILIFVAFRDSGNPNGLIVLGVSAIECCFEDVIDMVCVNGILYCFNDMHASMSSNSCSIGLMAYIHE